MQIELNQAFFKRLVQLYLLSLGILLVASIYSVFSPPWSAFSDEFDALATKHFGGFEDALTIPTGIVLAAGIIWNIAAIIGLLFFKRWARWGLWASVVLLWSIGFFPGFDPTYASVWTDAAGLVDNALLGAILLTAYSREHGGKWFALHEQQQREIDN